MSAKWRETKADPQYLYLDSKLLDLVHLRGGPLRARGTRYFVERAGLIYCIISQEYSEFEDDSWKIEAKNWPNDHWRIWGKIQSVHCACGGRIFPSIFFQKRPTPSAQIRGILSSITHSLRGKLQDCGNTTMPEALSIPCVKGLPTLCV